VRNQRLLAALVALTGCWLTAAVPGHAQEAAAGAGQQSQADQETRKTPAMRERVYTKLSEAQACAEMDDYECSRRLLEEVRGMQDLNSYELAQMWNFYAFIYFNQENYREAITAYQNVLEQADLPLGLEQATLYTLTQLQFQAEDYAGALSTLERWFAVAENPAPEPYILKAQIHYQQEQFREGIEPVMTALKIAEAQGKEPQENWYRLLNVFYYELEDIPNVVSVLRTMIERWPKREYFIQLAGMFGEQGNDQGQLAMFEVAFEAGWLVRGTELVNYSQMLMQADIPAKAAAILEKGLQDGTIESTEQNWRMLAQAWQLAQDDRRAVPALSRAASLANDGMLDVMLAQSHQNLGQWQDCVDAAEAGLTKGGLRREDQAQLILGGCLFELKQYEPARRAFQAAGRDDRSSDSAAAWLSYIEAEQDRERQLAAAMRRG
jgi:tetratricopeptide (TPR) repeat protein